MNIADQITRAKADLDEVYAKGIEVGKLQGSTTEEAYNYGFENGKKSEYDAFWDSYLNNGNLTVCDNLFAGKGWNNSNFKPTYSLKPTRCNSMFSLTNISGSLSKKLNDLGIKFDFSNCTLFSSMFTNALNITEIPPIDLSKATNTSGMFVNASEVITVGTLNCSDNTVLTNNMFDNMNKLENITFSGVITSSIRFAQSSKLTKESVMSIVNALKDLNGTGKTATLTLHANTKALLTDAEKAEYITQKGWTLA